MNSYCETFHVQRINLSYGAIEEFGSARSLPFAGPIVVVGIKNHQHRHWHADLSARTGFQFDNFKHLAEAFSFFPDNLTTTPLRTCFLPRRSSTWFRRALPFLELSSRT